MKHRNLRLPAAALLLALSLPAAAACQTPPAATPDTDGATLAEGTTAATTEAATTEKVTDPATDPVTEAPTAPVTDPVTEPETEPPVPEITVTVDEQYVVYLSNRADSLTRMAVYLVVEKFKEMAGMELTVVDRVEGEDAGEAAPGFYLEVGSVDEVRGHRVTVEEGAVTVTATDTQSLYFATEAVLEAWLAPDSGYVSEGSVYLDDLVAEDLSALPTRLDTSIRIMTQNMRGVDDPNGNTVQLRSARFIQMVEEYQPDLIGTQEYSYNWQVRLKKHEKQAGGTEETRIYGQVGCSNHGPDANSGGMNAILYRLDRFELLDSDTFWLSYTPDTPSVVSGPTRDKRICTWVKLKDKRTGEVFFYANTHLDHQDDELREIQATILVEQLTGIVGDYPLYLTGDFNCGAGSEPYNVMKNELALKDSHATAWKLVTDNYGTYHAYNTYGWEIDFILHHGGATAVHYEVVTKSYDGFVSDHYAVFAEFVN